MSPAALQILQDHTKRNNLDRIFLSTDGKIISFREEEEDGLQIDATVQYPVLNNKASYSLASLFLLCKNSNSLASYHRDCAEYSIKDMVKAYDRENIFDFFSIQHQQQQWNQQEHRQIQTFQIGRPTEHHYPANFQLFDKSTLAAYQAIKNFRSNSIIDRFCALGPILGLELKFDDVFCSSSRLIHIEIELGSLENKKDD